MGFSSFYFLIPRKKSSYDISFFPSGMTQGEIEIKTAYATLFYGQYVDRTEYTEE